MYDNLEKNEILALAIDIAVQRSRQDDWRNNAFKVKKVRNAIREALFIEAGSQSAPTSGVAANIVRERPPAYLTDSETEKLDERLDKILSLVKNRHEY